MDLFHGGRLATIPPKLVNEAGDLFLYRPLPMWPKRIVTALPAR